jgi:hypothetical protein
MNPSPTDTVAPRLAVADFLADEKGAPQCAFQHHDDMTSGTVPADVERLARGGPASTSAAIRATTAERYRAYHRRTLRAEEKIIPLRRNLM